MRGLGCDFSERLEDEASLRHRGMRNRQVGSVYDGVSAEKNIDVNGARTLPLDALTPHRFLDRKYVCHQLSGSFAAFQRDGAVQEPRLIGDLDRFGFIERRERNVESMLPQPTDRLQQMPLAVPYIRSQR